MTQEVIFTEVKEGFQVTNISRECGGEVVNMYISPTIIKASNSDEARKIYLASK